MPSLGHSESCAGNSDLRIHQIPGSIPPRKMNECALKREYHKKDFHLTSNFRGELLVFNSFQGGRIRLEVCIEKYY